MFSCLFKSTAPAGRLLFRFMRPAFAFATDQLSKPDAVQQDLLSKDALDKCSSLMRRILTNATVKDVKFNAEEILQDEGVSKEGNHDLVNFRHMLAGPLLSEANLDKFCLKKKAPLLLDVKYDGERTMISYQRGQQLEMISRNGKPQDSVYRHLRQTIYDQLEASPFQSVKLDGEIVLVDREGEKPLPFNDLQKQRRQKEDPDFQLNTNQTLLVYVFDVLEKDGKDLLKEPLLERRKLIPSDGVFRLAESRIVHFPEERAKIFEYFREVLERKYEGLIIKGCQDPYYTNDSRSHWKKLKRGFASNRDARISKVELDLIVMGANRGQGSKNSRHFTSYLLGASYQGKILPVSNVGSGLTEEMMAVIAKYVEEQGLRTEQVPAEYDLGTVRADVYYKPALVFEVHAQELTVSPLYRIGAGEFGGLSLRFPVFKAIRSDKGVGEATSGEEILELSKSYNFNLPV